MTIQPPHHILTEILLRRKRMILAIGTAIDLTFTAAERGCAGRPGEVDRLVYFFLKGLPAIEWQFNAILDGSGVRTTLSGIFCHQTPRVEPIPASPTKPAGCELGDILFLVTYGGRLDSRYLGNALLVQAKENAATVDGTTQSFLYSKATDFIYRTPGQLAPGQRSLDKCEFALWYWGFHHHRWIYPGAWTTEGIAARPDSAQGRGMPFEVALMDLICGVNGRRVKHLEANDPETGWNKIVDDLIRVTARSCFKRQNAYVSRNKELLRGDEVVRALRSMTGRPNAPFVVRCSLDRIFRFFDPELKQLGSQLTRQSRKFDRNEFLRQHSKAGNGDSGGEIPPTLGSERQGSPDGDDGGCSFVIINFEDLRW